MNKKIKLALISGSLVLYYFYIHRNDEADENKIVYHPQQTIGTTSSFGKCSLSVVDMQQGKTTNDTIPMCHSGYKMKAEGKEIITCPGSGSYTLDNIKYNYNCSYTPGQSEFTRSYTTIERNYKYQWAHDLFNY